MKILLTLGLILGLFLISCKKQTIDPEKIIQTNNQQTNTCDTINCLQATAQGTYTFAPNNGSDTIMPGCKVRMTFDGIKDSTAVYGGINNDSLMFYSYKYWYKMTPINFSNTIQTTNNFYNRLICTKGSLLMAVSFYTKSGKRAIFHI